MKINQIVSEHKKGVKAKIYNKKGPEPRKSSKPPAAAGIATAFAEGAEFGAYYSEQVAQQIFNKRQDITSEDEVLNQAYHIVANDLGQRSARYKFNYDEDFPSDVVSSYFWLQKHKHKHHHDVAEGEIERQHGDIKPWAYWQNPERVAQKLYKIHGGKPIGKDEVKHLWKVDGPDRMTKFMLKPDLSAILSNYQAMSTPGDLLEDDASDVEQRMLAKIAKYKEHLAHLKKTDPEAYKRELEKHKSSSRIPPVSTFESTPKDPNAPKMVQDRKTGKWYDPNKEFDKKMNSPEVKAQMKRMAQKEELEVDEDMAPQVYKVTKSDPNTGLTLSKPDGTQLILPPDKMNAIAANPNDPNKYLLNPDAIAQQATSGQPSGPEIGREVEVNAEEGNPEQTAFEEQGEDEYGDVGGDATDSYIDSVIDKDFERAQGRLRELAGRTQVTQRSQPRPVAGVQEAKELDAMLRIAGLR